MNIKIENKKLKWIMKMNNENENGYCISFKI